MKTDLLLYASIINYWKLLIYTFKI